MVCYMASLTYLRLVLLETSQLICKVNWFISFYKMATLAWIGSLVFLNKYWSAVESYPSRKKGDSMQGVGKAFGYIFFNLLVIQLHENLSFVDGFQLRWDCKNT